jgi:dipeptidyl aminopeptidase/acylaminoacyl peptidase
MKNRWFFLASACLMAGNLSGQAVPGPSFRATIDLKSVGSPAISPDGGAIAYTVRQADWKANGYDTEIWLWRDGAEAIQLTRTEKGSSSSPKWSPDGAWIGFLAVRGERQQVFAISSRGGEAMQLTHLTDGVCGFEWSPRGSRLFLLVTEPDP